MTRATRLKRMTGMRTIMDEMVTGSLTLLDEEKGIGEALKVES
jgi:hypothetical protein